MKEAFQKDFLIGAALNPAQFCEANPVEAASLKRQFNSISPENVLKREAIHPEPGEYDFTLRITELDVNVLPSLGHALNAEVSQHYRMDATLNPYTNGLPDAVRQQLAQALRGFVFRFSQPPRQRQPRDGWRLLAQRLARSRTNIVSAAL